MPKDELQQRWIEAIEQHQPFLNNDGRFAICQKHFHSSDFFEKNRKVTLKVKAVPSIFSSDNKENENEKNEQPHQCNNCYNEVQNIKELQRRILDMDIKHQLDIRSNKLKIDHLQKKNTTNIHRLSTLVKEQREVKIELKSKNVALNLLKAKYQSAADNRNQKVRYILSRTYTNSFIFGRCIILNYLFSGHEGHPNNYQLFSLWDWTWRIISRKRSQILSYIAFL